MSENIKQQIKEIQIALGNLHASVSNYISHEKMELDKGTTTLQEFHLSLDEQVRRIQEALRKLKELIEK